MRAILKWIIRIVAVLAVVAIAIGPWKREEITRLMAVNTLFDEDHIVQNFSNMERAFLTRPVPRRDGPVSDLPVGAPIALPGETEAWLKARNVTSLIVTKDGALRHESYHLGTGADDLRISWSMAKSYLSVLLGILLDEGAIASIDDPVVKYAPNLKGSAYEDATIKNVLQMTSGVTFNEDYLDYHSDINKMGRVLALGGRMDGFTADLKERDRDPGEAWHYVSIDTHVIAMVIRGATGRDIASLLSEKVIAPLGQEQPAYYLTDGEGVAFALGGLNLTSRDYARFGIMVAQDGRYNGQQIVPAEWIETSTAPSAPTAPGNVGYGYQWWIPVDARPGVTFARGIYGQWIYIDRARDIVIVTTSADRNFRDAGVAEANIAMFEAIANGF